MKAPQVTFIHTIYTNKSTLSNFHIDNMLKKLLSRQYTRSIKNKFHPHMLRLKKMHKGSWHMM